MYAINDHLIDFLLFLSRIKLVSMFSYLFCNYLFSSNKSRLSYDYASVLSEVLLSSDLTS